MGVLFLKTNTISWNVRMSYLSWKLIWCVTSPPVIVICCCAPCPLTSSCWQLFIRAVSICSCRLHGKSLRTTNTGINTTWNFKNPDIKFGWWHSVWLDAWMWYNWFIFILRQLQTYLAKYKEVYFFVDLEKAFDSVPTRSFIMGNENIRNWRVVGLCYASEVVWQNKIK